MLRRQAFDTSLSVMLRQAYDTSLSLIDKVYENFGSFAFHCYSSVVTASWLQLKVVTDVAHSYYWFTDVAHNSYWFIGVAHRSHWLTSSVSCRSCMLHVLTDAGMSVALSFAP